MVDESEVAVTAVCGDLMLAKDCIADLRSAGFPGDVALELSNAVQTSLARIAQCGSSADLSRLNRT
jgi:hypothetical protein